MDELAQAADLPTWLAAQRAQYEREPGQAFQQLAPALRAFERVAVLPPGRIGVELVLFFNSLAHEAREPARIAPTLERTLQWCEPAVEAGQRVEFLCARVRQRLLAPQLEQGQQSGIDLEQAMALAQTSQNPVEMGLALFTLATFAGWQREPALAVLHAREAIARFKHSNSQALWVHAYGTLVVNLLALQDRTSAHAALQEGLALCIGQRRWSEAANLGTGLVDLALESGDVDGAEDLLAECQRHANLASRDATSMGQRMVLMTRARCVAARGQYDAASALIEPLLDRPENFVNPRSLVQRLHQQADWLALAGHGERALALARRATRLDLDLMHMSTQRAQLLQRQRMELTHAEAQRQRSNAQAGELRAQNRALEQAIELQRELQAELIESSKLASLGSLLAGVAHELNTPLGTALTAISTSVDLGRGLHSSVSSGALTRGRLQADLDGSLQGQQLAQQCLQRALELVASYRQLHAIEAPPPLTHQPLAALVQTAWERALLPGSALQLQLDVELELVLPAEALVEILLQLFQNVERHAYAPGQTGPVQVRARLHEGQMVLEVSDTGRGIAPELLPRVFEPYVSSQFGRGRSGLGLFVAQASVKQHLGGRIRAFSEPGAGSRFVIDWPQA